ncbi:MAG: 4Fe-4S binding protein [Chloroflexi bacterium]|nr:4Fe-4S binding protein [Chloroflexota bacterium]
MPDVPTTDRAAATVVPAARAPHPDDSLFSKEAGELKEAHLDRLASIAPPLLDIDAYVEEFGRSVVPAYRRGIADRELPADAGLARSIIPPATSAVRDFSKLAPRIPDFLAEKCVGCMACVSACPDTAILGVVVPAPELETRIVDFAGSLNGTGELAATTARSHFTDTQKYGEVPARKDRN